MNLFELAAVLTLDRSNYDKGLDDAQDKANSFGSSLKSGLVATAKAGAAAIGAASTAVAAFSKEALDSYGNYEQLVGGIETLFKDSADTIMGYADDAYKTAGMSANQYMETVTSFSASLIQSTGRGEQQDIDELEAALDQRVIDTKRSLEDEYKARQEAWKAQIALARKNKSANVDLLTQQRDAELTALKRANEDKIRALKAANEEEIKAAERSNNASVTTEESLQKAAELANMAITDMSDNANKLGGSMESLENAYKGFAKQNFTMLDNLQLGYTGSKEGMEKLLADAEALTGKKYDLSSYADIVEAIHEIQISWNITGTTAKEASSTIQGSLSSMKSAWENLITGIADENADLPGLMNEVVESAVAVGKNIVPRVKQILEGIGTAIQQISPILSEQVMPLISDMLPDIVEQGVSLITNLVDAIVNNLEPLTNAAVEIVMKLIDGIGKMLPKLVAAGMSILKTLLSGIGKNTKTIVLTITDVVLEIAKTLTDPDSMMAILDAGLSIIEGLVSGIVEAIPKIQEALPQIIENIVGFLISALPKIIETGFLLLTSLINELPRAIEIIVAAIPQIILGIQQAIFLSLPKIIEGGIVLFTSLIDALPSIIVTICSAVPEIILSIVDTLMEDDNLEKMIQAGVDLFTALVENTPKILEAIITIVPKIITGLVDEFGKNESVDKIKNIGVNMIEGIWNGILQMKDWIQEKVSGFFGGIVDTVKDTLGIHSPSKVFAEIGKFSALGVGEGFGSEFESVKRDIDKQLDFTATANVQASGGAVSYSGYQAAGNQAATAPGADVRQPLVVVLQLPSGVEVGRQYIEDINLAKRVDGLAY